MIPDDDNDDADDDDDDDDDDGDDVRNDFMVVWSMLQLRTWLYDSRTTGPQPHIDVWRHQTGDRHGTAPWKVKARNSRSPEQGGSRVQQDDIYQKAPVGRSTQKFATESVP